jgi:hypothetical protein
MREAQQTARSLLRLWIFAAPMDIPCRMTLGVRGFSTKSYRFVWGAEVLRPVLYNKIVICDF